MKFPKGIRVKDLRPGDGAVAEKGKVALVHYDCFLPRGEKCGTSRDRSGPFQFEIGRRDTYPALEYGVRGMAVGGLRSIRVSPQLTYYERRRNPQLPPGAALRYEVELLRLTDEWENGVRPNPVRLMLCKVCGALVGAFFVWGLMRLLPFADSAAVWWGLIAAGAVIGFLIAGRYGGRVLRELWYWFGY